MQFLIDGHNLIARMPDISLADPDDEAKLVARLKRWAAGDRARKVTVIFDAGLPAGQDRLLSSGNVKVIFAPSSSTADALIIRRLRQARDSQGHTVVSSDQEVIRVAQQLRVTTIRSEVFAGQLSVSTREPARGQSSPAADEPRLSPNELAEWLAIFGPEPESNPPPPRKRKKK